MPSGKLPQPPATEAKALELLAQGMTYAHVAKELGVSKTTVYRIAHRVGFQARLDSLRNEVRERALAGVKAITPPALKWAAALAKDAMDAKAFDQVTRGLVNLERVGASAGPQGAASEPVKVEVVVLPGWVKQAQAKVVDVSTPAKPTFALPHPPEEL